MIISKTPLRISFIGGGTDYFHLSKDEPGHVISTTINKFVYVFLNKKFENDIRVSYFKNENCLHSKQIKHNIIRESLSFFKLNKGIELVTCSDIPSSGSGLGSSSSLTVGLLNALYYRQGNPVSKDTLARKAYYIEHDMCQKNIGLQDQFNASFGGFKEYKFYKDKKVKISKINISKKRLKDFKDQIILFYSGINRKAEKILDFDDLQKKKQINKKIKLLTKEFKFELEKGDINRIGEIIHESWILKKSVNKKISYDKFDYYYDLAKRNGATGGKILGAGGGGFFLFFADKCFHEKIKKKLNMFRVIDFNFYDNGSKILNI